MSTLSQSATPLTAPSGQPVPTVAEARAYCRKLARQHYENFTVARWLAPRRLRQHLANVYAYCRGADDLADESANSQAALAGLDTWQQQLEACYEGRPTHPVFVALASTIEEFEIPRQPFLALLTAFRQDQTKTRYKTFTELREYTRGSADPVGRIVLYLGRCHNQQTTGLSDFLCTGLQLANFCQDVARDYAKGRIYLPQESFTEHGCEESQLTTTPATPEFRRLLAAEVARAETFLREGEPLVPLVSRQLKPSVELFLAGGLEILAAIRRGEYDVLTRRPTLSRVSKLHLASRAALRRLLAGGGRR